MNKNILLLILITFSTLLFAEGTTINNTTIEGTDASITGHVVDKTTGEHLPFVNIQLKGTSIGSTTDVTGHYLLTNLPVGETVIVFSMVGYKTAEYTINLKHNKTHELYAEIEESSFIMDQVVVTANKYETKKRETAAIVNVVSPLMFETTTSNNIGDVLNYQTGLRVENGCQNCGQSSLRINGLEGQYSLMLIDGRPMFSSLASVYGLEQMPAGMIDRVEVMRGGGSAVYGSNAVAGVVNIITKEPTRNSFSVTNTTQLIGGKSFDVNTNLNGSYVSSDSKIGLFLFGVHRDRDAYDHDGDGFTELPSMLSTTLGMRSYFKITDYSKLTLEYHHVSDARRGGNMLDQPEHEADIAESLEHTIDAGSLKWDYFTDDAKHFVSAFASMQNTERKSYFGAGQDLNAYGNSHDFITSVGGQYRYHFDNCIFMPADLSAGAEYTYNTLHDQMLGYDRDITQSTHLYGGYVQNEWKNDVFTMLMGVRVEKHSMMDNAIASPRFNVRYTPIKDIVLRASYASGYRAPQLYDEDLHISAVGGELLLTYQDPELKAETSHSFSLSTDWAKRFGNGLEANVMVEGFYTRLNDVFTLEYGYTSDNGDQYWMRTNEKGAYVTGVNLESTIAYKNKFTFQLGYTYQQSRYMEAVTWSEDESIEAQTKMFRTPDHYGYFMANYMPIRNFNISLNGTLTGPMLVQHLAGYVDYDMEVTTPTFFDMGVKLAYDIPIYNFYTLQVNAGVKNIFNSYQTDFDQGADRDAGYIYGPSLPRTVFVGFNLTL